MGNVISRTEAKIRRHTHIINSVDMNGLMSLCVCIYILNVACIKKTHAKFKCIESSTHICIYEFIFGVTTAKFSKSIENFQANCKKKNPNFPIYNMYYRQQWENKNVESAKESEHLTHFINLVRGISRLLSKTYFLTYVHAHRMQKISFSNLNLL